MSEAVANAGANVAILYRSHPDAEKNAAKVAEKFGVKVGNHELMVETIEKASKELEKPIIGLMANAGVSVVKPALELSKDDFDFVYSTNVSDVAIEAVW
jgi:sorbose reductase